MREPLDLEAIRARCEAATPGPWKQDFERVGYYDRGAWCTVAAVVTWEGPDPDAEFIAHARSDIPSLLAVVERLQARVEDLETLLEQQRWPLISLAAAVQNMVEAGHPHDPEWFDIINERVGYIEKAIPNFGCRAVDVRRDGAP